MSYFFVARRTTLHRRFAKTVFDGWFFGGLFRGCFQDAFCRRSDAIISACYSAPNRNYRGGQG
jgi:hypothetical protein